jgi:hypothetical protein
MAWCSIIVETNIKPEVWLWMCHVSYVLNEDTWIAYKFWWSSMIRVSDLIYHEEGWVMLLQYFGCVVLTSLFLMMSFRRRWCDICVLQTAFLSWIAFLRYDASRVLFRMSRFYLPTICATLLLACVYTNVLHAEKMLCCCFLSKCILEECEKLSIFAILCSCLHSWTA